MDRLLRDTQGTVKLEIRDANGVPVNADSAPVSTEVTDSAGIEISGSPFTVPHPPPSTGVYELVLSPARTAQMDLYQAEWTAAVGGASQKFRTHYEVVGNFIFGLQELRDSDAALASVADFPISALSAAREAAEERIEELCGLAFRPRARRLVCNGSGKSDLLLPDLFPVKVVSAKVDGVALTAPELADLAVHEWGAVRRKSATFPSGSNNVEIFYEHGMAQPPEPVRRAALLLARSLLLESFPPDRATSFSTQEGTFRLAVAGKDGPTGIPEVDAVIAQFSYQAPVLG